MLDSKPFEPGRLLTGFAFTPMLSGFYPAIFLAEPSLMPLGLLVGYATAALMGLPMVVLFDRHHWRSWWQFALGGAICALPVMAYAAFLAPEHFRPFGPYRALGLLVWGAASGVVFWLLSVLGETPVSLRSLFDPLPPNKD